jgi:type II secretory pathway component PulF
MAIEHAGGAEGSAVGLTSVREDRLLGALLAVVLLCLLLGMVLTGLWDPVSGFVLLTALTLVVSGLALIGCGRLGQRNALLATLAIAVERGMPLTAALEALADQRRGRSRRRLLALTRLLNEGAPLPQALAQVPGSLPRDAEVAIGVGWASGRLAGALREAADTRGPERALRSEIAPRLAYLVGVQLTMGLIVSFVLFFIIPKFEVIFADFGLTLPRITVAVIVASRWIIKWGWPILSLMTICELTWAVLLPFSLASWLGADLFWVDRLFRSRHTAPVLRALAWMVEGGKPLSSGVASLIRCYPAGWVQGRLTLVLHDLGSGADVWKALRDRTLIGPADAAILESANRVGNLPWAMRAAADGAARRSLLRIQGWIHLLTTLVVLVLGIAVLVLVTAFFLPLVTLIESLAS